MRDIPPKVSKDQLPWVQVTLYHPHNSVNLPRNLLHGTLHLSLGGDGLGHLYLHYTAMVTANPVTRITFWYTLLRKSGYILLSDKRG